jgi:hypothetical protein
LTELQLSDSRPRPPTSPPRAPGSPSGASNTAHGLKAGARLAVNASPEPFSNCTLSFGEEIAVATIIWTAVAHPVLALAIAAAVLVAAALAARWIARAVRGLARRSTAPSRRVPG